MRKIFLEGLPRWGKKGRINWKECIGYRVKFIYDDISGEVEIVNYNKENRNLSIKYGDNIYLIYTSNFIGIKFEVILQQMSYKYKYEVGQLITNVRSGKIKILEQIRIKDGKSTKRGYKYKCLNCGNIDIIKEFDLISEQGCNVCCVSSKKVLIGYNDMWTTNPELARLLANPEDGYKYSKNSGLKVNFKCPDCGNVIKNKVINNISIRGLSCLSCGDKISYSEKFLFNFLQQLDLNFINQLSKTTLKWCEKYRYDFYFEYNNDQYIIESHGLQHYEEGFQRITSNKKIKILEEEQENDKLKKELALANGIKEEHYIVIDCRYSDFEFIKNNILNSEINKILDLNNINWIKCHEFACSSRVKEACDLWNNSIHSSIEISKIMKLSRATIIEYLKRGRKLNWVDYNPKKEIINNAIICGKNNRKKIICLNTEKIFDSITEAEKQTGFSGIEQCCNNLSKYSGKTENGEYLQWQFYDEYLFNPKTLLGNEDINSTSNRYKKVICMNNKKVFNSINEAVKYAQLKTNTGISLCCNYRKKSAGKHPVTNEPLKWMYYDEYLQLNKEVM